MEFDCKYAKPSGEIVSATLVGQTLDEVRHHLQEQGLLPISVRQKGWALNLKKERGVRIKTENFILFNQQFAALIKAGLPILRSLDPAIIDTAVALRRKSSWSQLTFAFLYESAKAR